jgi:hypothetical protein
MNQTFKTSRVSNRKYILFQLLPLLVIALAYPIYRSSFLNRSVDVSYYYIISIVLVFGLFREFNRDRVIEIEFNSESQQIIFLYQKVLSSKKQKTLSFKNAKLEIDTRYGWRGKSLIIYFLSAKVEYFKIEKTKDGFSNETLVSIRDFANKLSLPISIY